MDDNEGTRRRDGVVIPDAGYGPGEQYDNGKKERGVAGEDEVESIEKIFASKGRIETKCALGRGVGFPRPSLSGRIDMTSVMESSKAIVGMLMVQAFATGLQLLVRVILDDGTFIFALMTYRHVVAAICVAPFAFIFERGKDAKLSFKIWVWLFFNALAGITAAMSLYYYGLRDTTATYAVSVLNLIPIITFIFAIIARVEALRLHTWAGRAKMIGAVLCVAGALSTSLYEGKSFYIFHHNISHSEALVKNVKHNWMRGTLMLTGSCLCYSTWYMLQPVNAHIRGGARSPHIRRGHQARDGAGHDSDHHGTVLIPVGKEERVKGGATAGESCHCRRVGGGIRICRGFINSSHSAKLVPRSRS
ncbi:hypothetical protein CRG98_016277 [Punica granatum]|uniref:WAT1-related protein n=1 Tax=Punica granatum TaxID=22663 RepID=A0A2I0K6F9_PUNGR|nr:hypothetical protein CRG98_016277 [Punica granatum]